MSLYVASQMSQLLRMPNESAVHSASWQVNVRITVRTTTG